LSAGSGGGLTVRNGQFDYDLRRELSAAARVGGQSPLTCLAGESVPDRTA